MLQPHFSLAKLKICRPDPTKYNWGLGLLQGVTSRSPKAPLIQISARSFISIESPSVQLESNGSSSFHVVNCTAHKDGWHNPGKL